MSSASGRTATLYTAEQTTTPIPDGTGRWSYFVSVQEDISERLKAQDQLIRLSKYDRLTGLPNRHQFMERLQAALERANRAGVAVAVMVMDLDNFKSINNSLGHAAGDVVIEAVAARVGKLMRTTDTLARLGGGDFGILLENVTDMAAASRTVRRILDCFRQPIKVEDQLLKVSASLGIAAYPKDDTTTAALLREAELAMYQAKAQGGHGFKYFDRDMDADIRQRVQLESDLRRAIDNNELWLAYQPQLDLVSRRVVGAEALIRWNHPTRGLVSPGEFIPLAESCGLILPIGDWIIREICRQGAMFTQRQAFARSATRLQCLRCAVPSARSVPTGHVVIESDRVAGAGPGHRDHGNRGYGARRSGAGERRPPDRCRDQHLHG